VLFYTSLDSLQQNFVPSVLAPVNVSTLKARLDYAALLSAVLFINYGNFDDGRRLTEMQSCSAIAFIFTQRDVSGQPCEEARFLNKSDETLDVLY
jgi:hypothetical protein